MTREEAAYLVYHEPERAIDLLVTLSEAAERLEAPLAQPREQCASNSLVRAIVAAFPLTLILKLC